MLWLLCWPARAGWVRLRFIHKGIISPHHTSWIRCYFHTDGGFYKWTYANWRKIGNDIWKYKASCCQGSKWSLIRLLMEAESSVLMTSAATPDSIKDDVQSRPPSRLPTSSSATLWRSENQMYFFLPVSLFTLIRLLKIRVSQVLSSWSFQVSIHMCI